MTDTHRLAALPYGDRLPLPVRLRALLAAECAAEAAAAGTDELDLQQGVWLRWLERLRTHGVPADPAAWLRSAVRAEAWRAGPDPLPAVTAGPDPDPASVVEARLVAAERRRLLAAAIGRLPGRCPGLLGSLLSLRDPTYPEVARELGMSQGSVGPVRSRCLGCLRRMLTAEVASAELGGMVR